MLSCCASQTILIAAPQCLQFLVKSSHEWLTYLNLYILSWDRRKHVKHKFFLYISTKIKAQRLMLLYTAQSVYENNKSALTLSLRSPVCRSRCDTTQRETQRRDLFLLQWGQQYSQSRWRAIQGSDRTSLHGNKLLIHSCFRYTAVRTHGFW